MNFIIFISQKLTKRNFERYGIEQFEKNKFNLKILDLTNIFDKKINQISLKYENLNNYKNLHKFNNYFSLLFFLFKQNTFYYTNACSYNSLFLTLIEKIIIFRGNTKIHFSTALIPKVYRNYLLEIKILLKKFSIFSLLRKTLNVSKNYFISLIQPDPKIAFISGQSEFKNFKKKKTKIIKSNCLDYNKVIKIKKKDIKKNCIVFLDENVPNHPDFYLLGMKLPYSRQEYWSEMKLIFENLYKKHKKKIIICLHPKSSKNDILFVKKFFKESKYKILFNKTLESVAKSFLVVAHFSTSIQFAISLKKNLILIGLNKFNDHQKKCINFYSRELNIPIIENSDFSKVKFYNKNKYDYFFKKYICAAAKKNREISWIKIINYCKSNFL
tara:strand:- start:398 stop:1552 length:1155 start_codon:yes stop_codon:yes gene_type:complete